MKKLRTKSGLTPKIEVVFIGQNEKIKRVRRNKGKSGIRPDMSQFYPLKAVLEEILGKRTYRKLKETGDLSDWKQVTIKLLNSIELAIQETVKIADQDFYDEVKQTLELGRKLLPLADDIADLFSYVSATLTKIVFLQIGYIPSYCLEIRPLVPKYWNLSGIRSVQYVQSEEQKRSAKEIKESKLKPD